MSKKSKLNQAVAERTQQRLAARQDSAKQAAQKRQQRREAQTANPQPQPAAESPTKRNLAQKKRPRVHTDLLTIAFRGPLAERARELAAKCNLNLSRFLQDAVLLYEQKVADGYKPGTSLQQWKEQAKS